MSDQALRPSLGIRPFITEEKKPVDIKTITEDEKVLAAGADQAFWKTLKKHFDNAISELDKINENAIAQGATRDQVGENTIVISLTKGVLRRIENVVEDAKEALDGNGGA